MFSLKVTLFAIGLVITVIGWGFDNASHLSVVREWVAKDAFAAQALLREIAEGRSDSVHDRAEPGVSYLLEIWPELQERNLFVAIGRGGAYLQLPDSKIGGEPSADFDLLPMVDGTRYAKDYTWAARRAHEAVNADLEKRVFRWSAVLFFLGLGISGTVGVYELITGRGERLARSSAV